MRFRQFGGMIGNVIGAEKLPILLLYLERFYQVSGTAPFLSGLKFCKFWW